MPGHEGKSIFLPVTGFRDGIQQSGKTVGRYWSSSLSSKDHRQAANFYTSSTIYGVGSEERHLGMAIRPVIGKYEAKSIKGVSIVPGSLTLTVGMSRHLNVRLEPENADNPKVTWSSGNSGVATVAKDGTVTAVSVGTTTVTVKTVDGGFTATCAVTVISPSDVPAPEAVDLGLSVKWANMNVGAISPEDYGDYFAWGETEPKSNYAVTTYKLSNGTWNTLTKYNFNSSYGTVDNKIVLDPEDDAAHVNWGGSWRMPTDAEWTELRTKCTWTWTTENGLNGRRVTGPNGKSIFLPAAGDRDGTDLEYAGFYGSYWSSSLYTGDPVLACLVYFSSGNVGRSYFTRYYGRSVRPVYGEFIPVKSISLDKTSLELNAGDKQQLTASVSPSNATAKDIHWASSDESIAKVDQDGLVTAVAPGTATITAYGSSGVSASCTVTVKEGVQAVDLGLPSGLKWASCNVGATKPEQFGDYFSWGETETKNEYTWSTYKWGNGDWDADEHLSKYNTDPSCGNVDGNTMLLPEDDVAQDKWKGGWRMPTDAEWTELRDYCTWTWTVSYEGTGVAGYIVEGTKNSAIFLPATGHMEDEFVLDPGVNCGYWSSNIDPDNPAYAWFVYFEEGGVYRTIGPRKYGYSVRPVSE